MICYFFTTFSLSPSLSQSDSLSLSLSDCYWHFVVIPTLSQIGPFLSEFLEVEKKGGKAIDSGLGKSLPRPKESLPRYLSHLSNLSLGRLLLTHPKRFLGLATSYPPFRTGIWEKGTGTEVLRDGLYETNIVMIQPPVACPIMTLSPHQ